MTEKKNMLINLPIMESIASEIKGKGEYRQNLGTDELAELVGQAIQLSMNEYALLTPKVTSPKIEIRDDGVIHVETAVNTSTPEARVGLKVNWQNSQPGVLKCVGLTLESSYSVAAKTGMFALGISDPDAMIKAKVMNPNEALGDVIREQMSLRGVKVLASGYTVDGGKVRVVVQGTKL